ncbi:hypothetical protein BaRGS_00000377 [Batillaria attramentaria]|uniref:EF-hand domain-containing protein n=1 Tax=Batillaria attramentaria TaxID=370345 RepID=A0ABD0M9H0_9CAEN
MGAKGSKLSKEDLRFLEENTNFQRNEIKQWFKGFMRDCPDGQLSQEKFKEVYAQFFPGGNPEEFCRHVFRSFDKDGSGSIEFKEFLLAINITSNKGNPKDKLNWAIYNMLGNAIADVNIDTPKERTKKIFSQMDTNNDGVLTKEEFTRGCMADQCLYQMLTADAGDTGDAK